MHPGIALSLLCLCSALPLSAQSADDLKDKYPVITAYEVMPGILMIPRFTDDGQVCDMTVEKRMSLTPKNGEMSDSFSSKEMQQVEDLLAPPSDRGEEARYLLPGSFVAGGSSRIERGFDNAIIAEVGTTTGGVTMITIQWKYRTCAATRSMSPK